MTDLIGLPFIHEIAFIQGNVTPALTGRIREVDGEFIYLKLDDGQELAVKISSNLNGWRIDIARILRERLHRPSVSQTPLAALEQTNVFE